MLQFKSIAGPFLMFSLLMMTTSACNQQPKEASTQDSGHTIILQDATSFTTAKKLIGLDELPPHLCLPNLLTQETIKHLSYETNPQWYMHAHDSTHILAAYPISHQAYNENVTANMNSDLIRLFKKMDDRSPNFAITKQESMFYSSQKWHSLKLKYQINPIGKRLKSTEYNPCQIQEVMPTYDGTQYLTIYYIIAKAHSYLFFEWNNSETDMATDLHSIQEAKNK